MLEEISYTLDGTPEDIRLLDKLIIQNEASCTKIEACLQHKSQYEKQFGITTQFFNQLGQSTTIHSANDQQLRLTKLYLKFLDIIEEADPAQTVVNLPELVDQIVCLSDMYVQRLTEDLVQFRAKLDQKQTAYFDAFLANNNIPLKSNANRPQKLEISRTDVLHIRSALSIDCYMKACLYRLSSGFNSVFLDKLIHKINSAVAYHFLDTSSKLHKLEQPGWMFKYLQETFQTHIGRLFIQKLQLPATVLQFVCGYFYEEVVVANIINRLALDIPLLKENNGLVYGFIDAALTLEDDLEKRYMLAPGKCLLERLALLFTKDGLLNKLLEFEASCFQNKVFIDFFNIDYSRTNLKNLQAFNIAENFNLLVGKLFGKYLRVEDVTLKAAARSAYQQISRNMIAHVKTSFQRVHRSHTDKYEVLLLFRKVEEELQRVLPSLKKQLPAVENLLSSLRTMLQHEFVNTCRDSLVPTHKQLTKALMDLTAFPNNTGFQNPETLQSISSCYKTWKHTIDRLNSIYYYKDAQVKRLFFAFLKQSKFNKRDLEVYLSVFEPFLKQLYKAQELSGLRGLIFMERSKVKQVVGFADFLSDQQVLILSRFDFTL